AVSRPPTTAGHCFFFSSRRRHTRFSRDWSSDVCSSDLAAGKRTGMYTSPHLVRLGERVQVDRTILSESEIMAYVDELKPVAEARSEERRVGEEWRTRWTLDREKKEDARASTDASTHSRS